MKKNKKGIILDFEEEDILSLFEKKEWKTIKNDEKEKANAQKSAAETLKKIKKR